MGCVKSFNTDLFFGFDTKIEYNRSLDFTLEAVSPIFTDAGQFALGFGTDIIPAMAMNVFKVPPAGVNEMNQEFGTIYPSPATDVLNVSLNKDYGKARLSVVDLTGREVYSDAVSSSTMQVDVIELKIGQYLLLLEFENGSKTQFKFAKK